MAGLLPTDDAGSVDCAPNGADYRTGAAFLWPALTGDPVISDEPTNARKSFGDIAPHLAEITDKVLFGDVWENPVLSSRDRSLVTITSLISLYRINELPFHFKKALENSLTEEEIIETITHLAFYAGWPPAMTALPIARKVFEDAERQAGDLARFAPWAPRRGLRGPYFGLQLGKRHGRCKQRSDRPHGGTRDRSGPARKLQGPTSPRKSRPRSESSEACLC
jgi:4-carboxymuconolactone decarboxylase